MQKLRSLMGINNKNEFWDFIKQFVKFGVIGVSNTLVSFLIYYILVYIGIHYLLANIGAFIISVLNSYYWNSKYVFQDGGKSRTRSLIKVYISYGFNFLLSTALLFLMVDIIGISEYIAPIINLGVTVPINFLLNKFWAFT